VDDVVERGSVDDRRRAGPRQHRWKNRECGSERERQRLQARRTHGADYGPWRAKHEKENRTGQAPPDELAEGPRRRRIPRAGRPAVLQHPAEPQARGSARVPRT